MSDLNLNINPSCKDGLSQSKSFNTSNASDHHNETSTKSTSESLHFKFFVIACMNLNESFQMNVIWPFLPFMVDSFGIDTKQNGFWVGVIASSFYVALLLVSPIWGMLSDRFGHRSVLLSGLIGAGLTIFLFGLSQSLFMAILLRFLCGLMNGNHAIAKSYVGFITKSSSKEDKVKGFGALGYAWGIGSVLAPAVGGLLSDPLHNYPSWFYEDDDDGCFVLENVSLRNNTSIDNIHNVQGDTTLCRNSIFILFFRNYPYFLPCLASATVAMFSWTIGFFKLSPVTIHSNNSSSSSSSSSRSTSTTMTYSVSMCKCNTVTRNSSNRCPKNEHSSEIQLVSCITTRTHNNKEGDLSSCTSTCSSNTSRIAVADERTTMTSSVDSRERSFDSLDEVDEQEQLLKQDATFPLKHTKHCSSSGSSKSLRAITLYGLLAGIYILIDEIFPLFLKTDPQLGGMGFNQTQVGIAMSLSGMCLVIYQVFMFPKLVRYLNYPEEKFLRYAVLLAAPLYVFFPCLSYLVNYSYPLITWSCLLFALFIKQVTSHTAFTNAFILIANSVEEGNHLGRINGVANSVASGVRVVGPIIGGALWSFSMESTFIGAHFFVYFIISVLCIVVYITASIMDSEITK